MWPLWWFGSAHLPRGRRKSDDSLYNADLATFDASTMYDQKDATGFLNLYGLPITVEAIMRDKNRK